MTTTQDDYETGTQPPPRRRHRKLLIALGAVGVLLLAVIVTAVATSGSHPTTATSKPPSTSAPSARSYADVESLLAAMAQNGAMCTDVKASASTVDGALTGADCSGASSGDTVVVVFKDHTSAVVYANRMLNVGQTLGTPTAEVVGPNWTVNTVPVFAAKVVNAIGGQLMTGTPAPANSAPAPSAPAPSPSALAAEPVGGTFTDTVTDSSTNTTSSYDVTLVKVDQNAQPANQFDTPSAGHLAAAEFTIKGDSGYTSDDANSDAVAVGSNGEDYTFSMNSTADGTNFNYGEFKVSGGQSVTGWVTFDIPAGVTVTSVQWGPPNSGQPATWTVGS